MSNYYTYQKFLLRCPYSDINLTQYYYNGEPVYQNYLDAEYSLYDNAYGTVKRNILLSELDKIIDTEDDFVRFINSINWIDELILVNDRPAFSNHILKTYSQNSIKAFLYRINHSGIKCLITEKQ